MSYKGENITMNYFKKGIARLLIMFCLSLSVTSVLPQSSTAVVTVQAASYSKSTIKAVQKALSDADYDCGTADGVIGKKTKAAIKKYQKANDLKVTGTINKTLLNSMGIKASYADTSKSNNSTSKKTTTTTDSKSTESTVYITNTGSKYHKSGCRYLRKSKIAISLTDAKKSYDACSVCKP